MSTKLKIAYVGVVVVAVGAAVFATVPVEDEPQTEVLGLTIDATTTTTEPPPTTVADTVPRKSATVGQSTKTALRKPPTTSSTSTTTAPVKRDVLTVARGELGKAGPYTEGGFWCAKFVTWVIDQSGAPFPTASYPSRLHINAEEDGRLTNQPVVGGLAFIDLFGRNNVEKQITHVAFVEAIDGDTVTVIQGNGNPTPDVVSRTTYRIGDGYLIDFAKVG